MTDLWNQHSRVLVVVILAAVAACGGDAGTAHIIIETNGGGTISIGGMGEECRSFCSVEVAAEQEIALVATPDATTSFSGWGGACTGTSQCIVSGSDAVHVTATFEAPGIVWSSAFLGPGVELFDQASTPSGDIVIVGTFWESFQLGEELLVSAGYQDLFIARLTAGGSVLWSKRFGGAGNDSISALSLASNGDLALAGLFGREIDFGNGPFAASDTGAGSLFVATFGADGIVRWVHVPERSGLAVVRSVSWTGSGNLIVAGDFTYSLAIGDDSLEIPGGIQDDGFVALYDPTGNPSWAIQLAASTGDASVTNTEIGSDGAIIVGGTFNSTLQLGTQLLTSAGDTDVFAARVGPTGAFMTSLAIGSPGRDSLASLAGADDDWDLVVNLGGPLVSGAVNLVPSGVTAIAFVEVEAATVVSARLLDVSGESSFLAASRVERDSEDRIAIAGVLEGTTSEELGTLSTAGSKDVVLINIRPDRSPVWIRRFGGPGLEARGRVSYLPGGDLLLGLTAAGGVSGQSDAVFVGPTRLSTAVEGERNTSAFILARFSP